MNTEVSPHKSTKRIVLVLLCLLLPLSLAYMVYSNTSTPKYAASKGVISALPVENGDELYLLSGELEEWDGLFDVSELASVSASYSHDIFKERRMEGKTYRFVLNTEYAENTWLLLSRAHKSRLWINDIEVLAEGKQSISSTDLFALSDYGDDTFSFVLQVSGSTLYYGYQGITFGARERLAAVQNNWLLLDVFPMGLAVMMLVCCISLYLKKRSEKYLLMIILVVLSIVNSYVSPRHPSLRLFGAIQYPATRRVIPVTFYKMLICLDYFALRSFISGIIKKRDDCIVIALVALGSLFAIIVPERASTILRVSALLLWAIQYVCLIKGARKGVKEAWILLAGNCLAFANEIFVLLLDLQVIPHGELDVLIMPSQYMTMAYIVTFVIATCVKFAGKFNEADELSENLERMVQEQVLEIESANANVIALQKQKQQFMSGMVHNLRNPLFALGGYMDLLDEEMPERTPSQAQYLELMNDKITYMSKMSKDLLLMTRLEEDVLQFQAIDFRLQPLLKSVAEDATARVTNKEISICVECDDIAICTDQFALRQVLDVLLDNALRYSPKGGKILINAHAEGSFAEISVSDEGPGIPEDAFPTLFDRYKSVSTGGSTGLGLSIAHALLSKQGGEIKAQNLKEGGAEFTFRLPLNAGIQKQTNR